MFAAVFIVGTAGRSARFRWPLLILMTLVAGAVPAMRAWEVFRAHSGFGTVLQWVAEHKANRKICWLITRTAEYRIPEYFALFSPDDWVVAYNSLYIAAMKPALAGVRPLYSAPGLWGTNAVYVETFASIKMDYRNDAIDTETRVYRVGDLTDALSPDRQPRFPTAESIELSRVELIPEVEFTVLDPPRLLRYFRPLPDPLTTERVSVTGNGFTPYSVLVLNGVRLPTRVDDFRDQVHSSTDYQALIATLLTDLHGCADAFVQDGKQRSNAIHFCLD